jgi:LacI family repressor for deo operon, udp, cdd, tsx, nupC, and nupG
MARSSSTSEVVVDIGLAFFSQAVRGIADAAHAAGFAAILANADEDLATDRTAIGVLKDERADGMVVAPSNPHDGHPPRRHGLGVGLPVARSTRAGLAGEEGFEPSIA